MFPLNRRISALLTPWLARWGFSPNQVTSMSLAAGGAAAGLFSLGLPAAWIGAALCLQLSYVLDNCDGEIARLTHRSSNFGSWFDLVSDAVIHTGFFVGLGAGLSRWDSNPLWAWIGKVAGFQVALTYLTFVLEQVQLRGGAAWRHPDPPYSEEGRTIGQKIKVILRGDFSLVVLGAAGVGQMGWLLWGGLIGSAAYWIPALARILVKEAARMRPRWRPLLVSRLGLFAGVILFGWVLTRVDLTALWRQVQAFHWRFGVIFLFYAVIFGLDTMGWHWALSPHARQKIRWDHLFRTRLAGEALNYVTPAGGIGGEPIKAVLLSRRFGVPLSDGVASVVIAKTTFVASMLLFVAGGVALTLASHPLPLSVARWVWVVFPALTVLSLLFLAVQFLGPFRLGSSLLKRLGMTRWLGQGPKRWDWAIVSFYRKAPGALAGSLLFHFLGWAAGAVEVYLILRFLGIPVTLVTACSIEALWVLLRSGAFLIPASLGASEGFILLICLGLGINAVSGLALGLIRRARELLWMGLGLLEFSRG